MMSTGTVITFTQQPKGLVTAAIYGPAGIQGYPPGLQAGFVLRIG